MLLLSLASCERNAEPRGRDSARSKAASTKAPASEEEPTKEEKDSPVLIEKKPPIAEPIQGQPGMVISPFNGKPIDVKGIAPGTLVADPTYPLEDKKYFRVPQIPDASNEPPKLLDPGILIRPKPPKEDEAK